MKKMKYLKALHKELGKRGSYYWTVAIADKTGHTRMLPPFYWIQSKGGGNLYHCLVRQAGTVFSKENIKMPPDQALICPYIGKLFLRYLCHLLLLLLLLSIPPHCSKKYHLGGRIQLLFCWLGKYIRDGLIEGTYEFGAYFEHQVLN